MVGSSQKQLSVSAPWLKILTVAIVQSRADHHRPLVGTRLIREWQGIEHCVSVLDHGYEYQGRPYRSLSAIARFITGTRWNGWIFFGLKNQRARS